MTTKDLDNSIDSFDVESLVETFKCIIAQRYVVSICELENYNDEGGVRDACYGVQEEVLEHSASTITEVDLARSTVYSFKRFDTLDAALDYIRAETPTIIKRLEDDYRAKQNAA